MFRSLRVLTPAESNTRSSDEGIQKCGCFRRGCEGLAEFSKAVACVKRCIQELGMSHRFNLDGLFKAVSVRGTNVTDDLKVY